jgi:hypothetical protein
MPIIKKSQTTFAIIFVLINFVSISIFNKKNHFIMLIFRLPNNLAEIVLSLSFHFFKIFFSFIKLMYVFLA